MVDGKWNITIKTPMGDKSGVLELKSEGTALTGTLSDAEHHATITDGKVIGDSLQLVRQDHPADANEFQVHRNRQRRTISAALPESTCSARRRLPARGHGLRA